MLTVRRAHTHAVISFVDEVSPESIIELVSTIDDLHDHFFYRKVILRIDSPGGSVDALQYYIEAMRRWQQDGPWVATRALTSCASAGAVMLSFGHKGLRFALESSRLHYHYARYGQGTDITRERAVDYIRSLEDADGGMLDCLVQRAMQCERPSCNSEVEPRPLSGQDKTALERDKMALEAIRKRLPEEHSRGGDDPHGWIEGWLAEISRAYENEDHDKRREEQKGREGRWRELYDALLKADCSISGTLAYRLRLIDELLDKADASQTEKLLDKAEAKAEAEPDASRDVAAVSATPGDGSSRSFHIGEWRNVYRDSQVPFDHLRRHILILGETGSGKTRSSVLPVLLAAYRSEEVSTILVIDPKRELHQELVHQKQKLESIDPTTAGKSKGIELITLEHDRIDLMSTDQWSIRKLTDNRKYWSAAERILQRVAGITAANPARILSGQPPVSSKDSYWERRGVKLATSVLAVAIECMAQPADIFGENGEYNRHFGIDNGRTPEMEEVRNALREIGETIGILKSEVPEQYRKSLAEVRQQAKAAEDGESKYISAGGNAAVVPEDIGRQRCDVLADLLERLMKARDNRTESDMHDDIDSHSEIGHKTFLYYVTKKLATSEEWGKKWERKRISLEMPYHAAEQAEDRDLDDPDDMEWFVGPEEDDLDYCDPYEGYDPHKGIEYPDEGIEYDPYPDWDQESIDAEEKAVQEYNDRLWEEEREAERSLWNEFWELDLHRRFEAVYPNGFELAQGPYGSPFERDIGICFPDEGFHRRGVIFKGEEGEVELIRHYKYISRDWDFSQLEKQTIEGMSTEPILWLWRQGPQSGRRLEEFIEHIEDGLRVVELTESQEKQTPNVLMIAELLLQSLCQLGTGTSTTGLHAIAERWRRRPGGEYGRIGQALGEFANNRQWVEKQYAGELGSTDNIWRELVADDVRTTLFFGCEASLLGAGSEKERKGTLDFFDDVGRASTGTVYVYQPELSGSGALMARAIKAMLFEAVLSDRDRRERGTKMPLIGYVADEFQRFVTADRTHGEQSFLDTCRSFGAFAVLACQSIASLEYALCDTEPNQLKLTRAVDIICTNTGTKLFFRSTDRDTINRLNILCPTSPDGRIVTQARPLATLRPGECYITFPDGRFERAQLGQIPERDEDKDGSSV